MIPQLLRGRAFVTRAAAPRPRDVQMYCVENFNGRAFITHAEAPRPTTVISTNAAMAYCSSDTIV